MFTTTVTLHSSPGVTTSVISASNGVKPPSCAAEAVADDTCRAWMQQ
jgi:hypothetical protein